MPAVKVKMKTKPKTAPSTKAKAKVISKARPSAALKKRVAFERPKGVSRIDNVPKNTHGWFVRVFFATKRMSKFFSDSLWEGKAKALEAAVKYRDQAERELGKPRTDRVIRVVKRTGKPRPAGVHKRVIRYTSVSGSVILHPVYEVIWSPEPGKVRRSTISIRKWGDKKAFEMATKLRLEKEKEIYGRTIRK